MLLYGIIILWLPQIIAFASALFIFFLMIKSWRATGNKGFLLLAIVTMIGELHFLALKMDGWLLPAAISLRGMVFNNWFSAFLGASGTAAWWLVNKHLAAEEATRDSD